MTVEKAFLMKFKCWECGYKYTLHPAVVYTRSDGKTVAVFGSDADFCPKCDSSNVKENKR